jgi:hypothetical protein
MAKDAIKIAPQTDLMVLVGMYVMSVAKVVRTSKTSEYVREL